MQATASGSVGPFLPLAGGTLTGPVNLNHDIHFTPSTGGTLGLTIVSHVSGTMGAVGAVAPFELIVGSNSVDSSGNPGASFFAATMQHNFGGTRGGQGTLSVNLTQTSDILDTETVFVGPGNFYLDIEYGGNNIANAIGLASGVNYGPGAHGWDVEGAEIAVALQAGSTVIQASALGLIFSNFTPSHASEWEAMLSLTTPPGSVTGLNTVISLGRRATQWPLASNGWIMTTYPQNVNNNPGGTPCWPQACAGGFDFSMINFSTAAFRSPGVSIENTSVKVGTGYLGQDNAGLAINATGSVGAVSGIASGGANYQVNDQLYDGLGGIILVTAVGGGGAVTAAHYIPNREPYTFSGAGSPVGTTGGSGAGASFNLTWTIRTQLSIQEAGGLTVFGGPVNHDAGAGFFDRDAPATKPTLTGAWAGNTAGKALATILASYGLLTDSSTA
jgi:hypothetical protein